MSRETLKGIDYMLRTMTDQHRVDVCDRDGSRVWRNEREPSLAFRLRSRPWIYEARLPEQQLLLASTRDTFDLVADAIALGAAGLRGEIFRDLLLNCNDYPVDFIGNVRDPQQRDAVLQKAEDTAVRLMHAVDKIRREAA